MLLLVLLYFKLIAASNDFFGPTDPTGQIDFSGGTACACPGSPVQYLCTVSDPSGQSATLWNGTAFDCAGNQASLFHDQYTSGLAADACSDGDFDLTAQGLTNVTANCYSSRLTVNVEPGLDGRTVECTLAGTTAIGSSTLSVAAPLAAPSSPGISIADQSFTVSWAPPTAECGNAVTYMYPGLAASMCGQCTGRSDTPSVTCREWTAQGQSCSITARADICVGQQGEQSQPVIVTLQEINAVTITGGIIEVDQSRQKYSLSFAWDNNMDTTADIIALSGGQVLVGNQMTYLIIFDESTQLELTCSSAVCNSPVLTREMGGSRFEMSVSLAARNVLGTGTFDTASCVLASGPRVTITSSLPNVILTCSETCTIRYGTDPDFQDLPFEVVSGQQLGAIDSTNIYYYEARITCGDFTIKIQDSFANACEGALSVAAIASGSVVVTFVVALVIGLPLGMLLMYCIVRKKLLQKSQERPPSPVYETMGMATKFDIKGNAAYGPCRR